ncbi:hypothetical protein [Rubellimicrobium aerolatum]|uniref:Uncharacterized protein n=1 Tax=Rubellimicrobium aerolatum TaxID=490979 RepID=A0ABW0SAQ0_9RHOB|nr:hypothetical protein [Rubellimicrobium aerolatum]MBP1806047.1 hypothetical protein [Rubellimicrobium aerolatum]
MEHGHVVRRLPLTPMVQGRVDPRSGLALAGLVDEPDPIGPGRLGDLAGADVIRLTLGALLSPGFRELRAVERELVRRVELGGLAGATPRALEDAVGIAQALDLVPEVLIRQKLEVSPARPSPTIELALDMLAVEPNVGIPHILEGGGDPPILRAGRAIELVVPQAADGLGVRAEAAPMRTGAGAEKGTKPETCLDAEVAAVGIVAGVEVEQARRRRADLRQQ